MYERNKNAQDYIDKKEFSVAVHEYVSSANEAKKAGLSEPIVTDYIARGFLMIANGLSQKANFTRYTFKEEMVMDAVENCLRAIKNYNIEAATRSGKPNAFGYFTQICWYAFIRRIKLELRVQDLKMKYISESALDDFLTDESGDPEGTKQVQAFVDELRQRIDAINDKDKSFKEYTKTQKNLVRRRNRNSADSDVSTFFE